MKNILRTHPAHLSKHPICVSLVGFVIEKELKQVCSLFTYSQRWEQPWKIVDEPDKAHFMIVATSSREDLSPWVEHQNHITYKHLIAYSEQPHSDAHWHLPRKTNSKPPSPLEFSILLKEIGKKLNSFESRGEVPKILDNIKAFNVKERMKIVVVGSVGAGKTTAVSTLCDGDILSTEARPSDQFQLQKKTTTVAMDFGCTFMDRTHLHVYGAPGQRRFDFMNDILLHKALGIIILVSNKNTDALNELNYYLNSYQDFLNHNVAVVGVTHNDISPIPSIKMYTEFIKSRGELWPVMKVDARKLDDMEMLIGSLLALVLKNGYTSQNGDL